MEQFILSSITKDELQQIIRCAIHQELDLILKNSFTTQTKEYLSVDGACEMYHMSKSVLYKLTSSREIPSIKNGKRLLLKKEDLDCYMERHKRQSVNEIRAGL